MFSSASHSGRKEGQGGETKWIDDKLSVFSIPKSTSFCAYRSQRLACRILRELAREPLVIYELLKAGVAEYVSRLLPKLKTTATDRLLEVSDRILVRRLEVRDRLLGVGSDRPLVMSDMLFEVNDTLLEVKNTLLEVTVRLLEVKGRPLEVNNRLGY